MLKLTQEQLFKEVDKIFWQTVEYERMLFEKNSKKNEEKNGNMVYEGTRNNNE